MLRVILIAASFSLAACQTAGGPPLVTYSAAQQQQAARELRAMPKGSQLSQMIVDYGKTRAAIRAGRR